MTNIERVLSEIPDKQYYRIGEVAKYTDLKAYVLRFWETEFKTMAPPKSRSKQRMYRKKDIEMILQIKELLYERGFTIKGARKRLAALARGENPDMGVAEELSELRTELQSLQSLLA